MNWIASESMSRFPLSPSLCVFSVLTVLSLLFVAVAADDEILAAQDDEKPIVTKPKYDPSARKVDFFDATKNGELETDVYPRGAKGGNLFIENKTDETLTVKMPKSFVGIHVHKQLGGMGMGGMGMGGMGMGGGMMGGGMMGGGMMGGGMGRMGGGMGQSMGGGMGMMGGMGGGMMGGMGGGMMGGMGGGMMGGGMGMYSIPPQTTLRVPYHSVCLDYGRPEPMVGMDYVLVPTDKFTKDERLQSLIGMVAASGKNGPAVQAATWHLSSKLSWRQLMSLPLTPGLSYSKPKFSTQQVMAARNIVAVAGVRAKKLASIRKQTGTDDKKEPSQKEKTIR